MHASPLLYDIDKDGSREIALATYNGEVIFIRYLSLHHLLEFSHYYFVVYPCLLCCWQVQAQSFFCNLSRVSGYMMVDKLVVPRRKVKKNWYVGLDPDPVDRSHPDVHDDEIVLEAEKGKPVPRKLHAIL